jgi:hypothetical protein
LLLGGAGTHATTASYFFSQKRFGRNTEAMAETTLANELAEVWASCALHPALVIRRAPCCCWGVI